MEIVITQEVYDKVMHWVNKADFEVSGFGRVVHDKETQTFRVVDAYLLKQEGGATTTDIDAAALGQLMVRTIKEEGELKWWWHSHVNMATFWSSTDLDTIKDMGKHGWITATVFNKKWEYKSAVCYKYASELTDSGVSLHDNVKTNVVRYLPEGATEAWDKEFDVNVTEKKYVYGVGNYGSWDEKNEWCNITHSWKPRLKAKPTSPISLSMVNAGMERDEARVDLTDPGMYGYGIEIEAKALGMSSREYWNLLCENDAKVIDDICEKLDELERTQGGYGSLIN